MDSPIEFYLVLFMVTFATVLSPTVAKLTPNYYDRICPKALPIISLLLSKQFTASHELEHHCCVCISTIASSTGVMHQFY
ncbi:unnamed protein product [Lathyrus sativus]|nr:unnamed protein product [Lathyrus sativus]